MFELPWDFDAKAYRELNPDLRLPEETFGEAAAKHFMETGMHEGRPYRRGQPVFVPDPSSDTRH